MTQGKLNVRCVDLIQGETVMRIFSILACLTAAASPVSADGFMPRPQSCKLVYTAQKSDCEVENRYRCETADGTFYRLEFFDDIGLTTLGEETSEFLPIKSVDESGDGIVFDKRAGLSPQEMLTAGNSTQALSGFMRMFGLQQPIKSTVQYQATGETVELGGKTFETLNGSIDVFMANSGLSLNGTSIAAYNAEADIFVEISTDFPFDDTGETHVVELFLEGQLGHGEEIPKHGCFNMSAVADARIGARA